VQPDHEILSSPLKVQNSNGELIVMKKIAESQSGMGEALTLDSIVNSVDAGAIALGPSGKGDNRGAIIRHGHYVLWSFEGSVSEMTSAGRKLFINTVVFSSKQKSRVILEKRNNGTRDQLFSSIEFARKSPGYLNTIKRLYIPESLSEKTLDEIENWLIENRPYLYLQGSRRFQVDEFAKSLGIPNHKKAFYERCIQNLQEKRDVKESLDALVRYTGRESADPSAESWKEWFTQNRDYVFFSDCDGFKLKIDEQAKAKKAPFEKLRSWSSENIRYKVGDYLRTHGLTDKK